MTWEQVLKNGSPGTGFDTLREETQDEEVRACERWFIKKRSGVLSSISVRRDVVFGHGGLSGKSEAEVAVRPP